MNETHCELYSRIEAFPLDEPGVAFPFTARLARENGWSRDYARRVVREYKRFAFLAVAAGHPVTPSDQVDQAWHLHLTYTRSYWSQFCPIALGKLLHHNPTEGGAAEQSKFHDWYNATLHSYERFFGHAPPPDIWPDASTRFGHDTHYRRVNTRRNWIVPKPPLKWIAGIAVLVVLTVWVAAGCSSTGQPDEASRAWMLPASAFRNPFDLPGDQFLQLLALAFACSLAVAAILRYLWRRPAGDAPLEFSELDPYDVAYLAGGEERAFHAVLASLVKCGILNFDSHRRRLLHSRRESETGSLHPAEQAVLASIDEQGGSLDQLEQTNWWWPTRIATRLKGLDLIVRDERDCIGRVVPTLIVLLVPLMGAIKIVVGLLREKPVGWLVFACIVATIVAFAGFGRRLHRTWEGDRTLRRSKNDHPASQDVLGESSTFGVAMTVAIFGIGALAGGSLDELQAALNPKDAAGCFGGCGGGGSDGGCGGGCGGCGGCG